MYIKVPDGQQALYKPLTESEKSKIMPNTNIAISVLQNNF